MEKQRKQDQEKVTSSLENEKLEDNKKSQTSLVFNKAKTKYKWINQYVSKKKKGKTQVQEKEERTQDLGLEIK